MVESPNQTNGNYDQCEHTYYKSIDTPNHYVDEELAKQYGATYYHVLLSYLQSRLVLKLSIEIHQRQVQA